MFIFYIKCKKVENKFLYLIIFFKCFKLQFHIVKIFYIIYIIYIIKVQ